MHHIRQLGQCKHYHLEGHNHGKQAKEIQRCGKFIFYPGNIPCAHGGADDDNRHRKNRNEKRCPEGVDKACFLNAVHIVFQSHIHLSRGNGKGLSADIGLFLKRVDEHQHNWKYINQRNQHKNKGKDSAVFCFSCIHYCCTSFLRVILFCASAMMATRIKNTTAFAWPTPSQPVRP